MSWYKKSSIRDDKKNQARNLIEILQPCVDSAMIDGSKSIGVLETIIKKLRGKQNGFRVIIRKSVAYNVSKLIEMAIQVKKDSPQEFSRILGEVMSLLVCEAE